MSRFRVEVARCFVEFEFRNPTEQMFIITDLKFGGVSVIERIRADMFQRGQLEDAHDAITVLPNESLRLEGVDTIEWLES